MKNLPILLTANDETREYFAKFLVGTEVRIPFFGDSDGVWQKAMRLIFELEFSVKKKKYIVVSANVEVTHNGSFLVFICKEI